MSLVVINEFLHLRIFRIKIRIYKYLGIKLKYNQILIFIFILLFGCNQEKFSERSKPNIIFIMADDLGWQDVGFMGSEWFETPNLDKLADESLVFTDAYMYPTCSPSRAALLTGKQSFRTGVYSVPV